MSPRRKQLAHFSPGPEESAALIDQGEHAGFRARSFMRRAFFGIHGHWLFTKNRLARDRSAPESSRKCVTTA